MPATLCLAINCRYADWAKRRHFNGPVLTGLRQQAADEQQQHQHQDEQQQPPVVSASTAWRSWPATADVRAARGVAGRYGPVGTSGSNDGGSSGSGSSEWEEPSVDEVEAEFWRIVEAAEEQVEALYGQDIDTATYCSAFPTIRVSRAVALSQTWECSSCALCAFERAGRGGHSRLLVFACVCCTPPPPVWGYIVQFGG